MKSLVRPPIRMQSVAAQAIAAAAKMKAHCGAGTFHILRLDGLIDLVVFAVNAFQIFALRQAIDPVRLQARAWN